MKIPTDYKIIIKNCPLMSNKFITQWGVKGRYLEWNIKTYSVGTLERKLFKEFTELLNLNLSGDNSLNITEDVFQDLTHLEDFEFKNLLGPKITQLPDDVFMPLHNLKNLELQDNNLKEIQPGIFRNQSNMISLTLREDKLRIITKESFEGLKKLENLNLIHTALTTLDENVFENLPLLRGMYFDRGCFESFPPELFQHNKNIWFFEIFQDVHSLTSLPAGLLSDLPYLREVHINCGLKEISDLFAGSDSIVSINIYGNYFHHLPVNIFRDQKLLVDINLSNNSIDRLDDKIFANNLKLTEIELSSNQLTDVNSESFQWLPNLKSLALNLNKIESTNCIISLKDPFEVICLLENIPYVRKNSVTFQNLVTMDLSNNSISNLDPNLFKSQIFLLKQTRPFSTCSSIFDSYSEVFGNLSYNVEVQSKLSVLKLSNNRLQNIDHEALKAIKQMSKLEKLFLRSNPWICDCSAKDFVSFIGNQSNIIDSNDVKCKSTGELVSSIDIEICNITTVYTTDDELIILVSIFAFLGITIGCLLAFYYKYSLEVKSWMYYHNICMGCVTEEDLDEDKIYDAFISYAFQDESYVQDKLMTVLEAGPEPYSLCIHFRDWIGGARIVEQVEKSVNESRRTIVVMSPDFLKSSWGQQEFIFAFQQTMKDRKPRVILIIKGDIGEIKKLSEGCPEVLAYLKTHTYIECGDRWFWNKLKYAMPHRGPKLRKKSLIMESGV